MATVCGEIDIYTVAILSEHLGRPARINPRHLVTDPAEVSFIDSSDLAVAAWVENYNHRSSMGFLSLLHDVVLTLHTILL
jgi:hypothetical protein